jgi:hypothetical protein
VVPHKQTRKNALTIKNNVDVANEAEEAFAAERARSGHSRSGRLCENE